MKKNFEKNLLLWTIALAIIAFAVWTAGLALKHPLMGLTALLLCVLTIYLLIRYSYVVEEGSEEMEAKIKAMERRHKMRSILHPMKLKSTANSDGTITKYDEKGCPFDEPLEGEDGEKNVVKT